MLAFLDLETTHRKPTKGSILEIAYIVTDDNLNVQAAYTQNVRPQLGNEVWNEVTKTWDIVCEDETVQDMHTRNGLLAEIKAGDCLRRYEVELDAISWLPQVPDGERIILVGNSIWFDRNWIEEHMPRLFNEFDRKLLDITSLNQFARLVAPAAFDGRPLPDRKKQHRAKYDAQQSLETFKYYKDVFGISPRQLVQNTLGFEHARGN